MVYDTWASRRQLHGGDIVWAYAFRETADKEGMRLIQEPVKGRIVGYDGQFAGAPKKFVPFSKRSETEYVWSKAVDLHSGCYGDSEADAFEAYNRAIDNEIAWYQEKIKALEEMKL